MVCMGLRNMSHKKLCSVFFSVFVFHLAWPFCLYCICKYGVKGDVFPCDRQRNSVTHSCEHAPVHFERQLYIGICVICCPKGGMYSTYMPVFLLKTTKHAWCSSHYVIKKTCFSYFSNYMLHLKYNTILLKNTIIK